MSTDVRADRAADHPSREPADHANFDPRREVRHPKVPDTHRRPRRTTQGRRPR
jgi:hypothetical protein